MYIDLGDEEIVRVLVNHYQKDGKYLEYSFQVLVKDITKEIAVTP